MPMRELEGEKSSTWEQRVWAPMLKAKREAMRNGEDEAAAAAPEHKLKPRHAEMIEQMMRAYRHEQGAPKVRAQRLHARARHERSAACCVTIPVLLCRSCAVYPPGPAHPLIRPWCSSPLAHLPGRP